MLAVSAALFTSTVSSQCAKRKPKSLLSHRITRRNDSIQFKEGPKNRKTVTEFQQQENTAFAGHRKLSLRSWPRQTPGSETCFTLYIWLICSRKSLPLTHSDTLSPSIVAFHVSKAPLIGLRESLWVDPAPGFSFDLTMRFMWASLKLNTLQETYLPI